MNPSLRSRGGGPVAARRLQARRHRGMTLIEVMVAILIFSFGLLGLVALQTRATQYSLSAEDANRAALLAGDMAGIMLTTNTVNPPAAVVDAWAARVADTTSDGLPNGVGTVAVNGNVATITLTWRPPNAVDANNHRYVTQVVQP